MKLRIQMIKIFTITLVLFANIAYTQPRFEDTHTSLLTAYVAKFGLPALNDDVAREWTRNLAEQFAFTFPNEGWGHKSGGGSRPPSTDVIARQSNGLWGYDVILSQGAASQSLINKPGAINLVGQTYIPVTPFNHLGDGGGVNPPPVIPPPVDLGPINAKVNELQSLVNSLVERIRNLEGRDTELNRQHFELSDFAHKIAGELGNRISVIEAKPIPTGCRASFLGRNVGCSLIF